MDVLFVLSEIVWVVELVFNADVVGVFRVGEFFGVSMGESVFGFAGDFEHVWTE